MSSHPSALAKLDEISPSFSYLKLENMRVETHNSLGNLFHVLHHLLGEDFSSLACNLECPRCNLTSLSLIVPSASIKKSFLHHLCTSSLTLKRYQYSCKTKMNGRLRYSHSLDKAGDLKKLFLSCSALKVFSVFKGELHTLWARHSTEWLCSSPR